jgi:hypothetical protein
MEIAIEDDYKRLKTAETATVIAKFEPAAIDIFGAELRALEDARSGSAMLLFGYRSR